MNDRNPSMDRAAAVCDRLPASRQAIICRYHGPTTAHPNGRISATAAAGRVYIDWPGEGEHVERYHLAARRLADRMGWRGALIPAGMPDGNGYAFVFLPDEYADAVLALFETRRAVSRGENNGNPHGRRFGRAVDNLTGTPVWPQGLPAGPFTGAYEAWRAKEGNE